MKKSLFFGLLLCSTVLLFLLNSCSSSHEEILNLEDNYPKNVNQAQPINQDIGLISQLESINQTIINNQTETKSFWDWPARVWRYAKADAVGGFKYLRENTTAIQWLYSLIVFDVDFLTETIIKSVGAAGGASKKAKDESNGGCAIVVTPNDFRKAELCMTQALYYNVVVQSSGSNTLEPNYDVLPDITDLPLLLPQDYGWAEVLGQGHNRMMSVYNLDETSFEALFVDEDIDELIEDFEDTYNIDSTYEQQYLSILNSIPYDIDYSLYFDDQEITENVMILFSEAVENYANSAQNVLQIVNQYISTIAASNELEDEEKAVLIGALSIAAYSADYWENYNANLY